MPERTPAQSPRGLKAVPAKPGTMERGAPSRRVLVVDDDPISRNIVRDLLASRGFEVDGSEDPRAALERVRRHRYDLLILDIFLPGMDGRVLHGSIEKINPALAAHTVFISHWMISGAIGDYVREHGVFLKKPFTADELMHAIELVALAGSGAPAK
jgi:CheY-like chemotaxis protein